MVEILNRIEWISLEMGLKTTVKLNSWWLIVAINWNSRVLSNSKLLKTSSINTKIKLVKTLVFSIFSHGVESWTLKKAYCNNIDAFEMWGWKGMLQIPWTVFRTKESILHELNIKTYVPAKSSSVLWSHRQKWGITTLSNEARWRILKQ